MILHEGKLFENEADSSLLRRTDECLYLQEHRIGLEENCLLQRKDLKLFEEH